MKRRSYEIDGIDHQYFRIKDVRNILFIRYIAGGLRPRRVCVYESDEEYREHKPSKHYQVLYKIHLRKGAVEVVLKEVL